ncbi:MAG: phenylalanine--tRNA ligase subunit beta, partial [Candidatus Omnitrophica bacterium]|nr:phenylalanine--tRNA ligase subunit beta [Candidatus Omnitrophota bacterium]
MKFTYNWIKDYIDLKLPAEELADRLTMAGLEVVALERKGTDVVFEVEITSNRPDWLSVLGIAREIAVLTGTKIKNPVNKIKEKRNSGEFIKVEVENNRDCPLYTARIINDVKVGPSPQWLKERLELIGCRSVNNVVDITNYCLFELGEPLHAFDLDKISPDRIIIRRGKPGERLVTIDG